jgi:hypothetical protein
LLHFWYSALASDRGVILRTNDPERAKQRLYAARREAKDPDLDGIAICTSPTAPESELWLVKKKDSG